jgi:hypothetical protein
MAAWIDPLWSRRYAPRLRVEKRTKSNLRLLNQDSKAWIGLDRRVREGFGLAAFFSTLLLT